MDVLELHALEDRANVIQVLRVVRVVLYVVDQRGRGVVQSLSE